jgi:uncharacterized protein (DUF58 family)
VKKVVKVSVTRTFWIILGAMIVTVLLAILFPYEVWWMVLLAFGLVFALSGYSAYHLKNDLHIQRQMRYGWAKVGDVLEGRIQVRNSGPIPAHWIEIEDLTDIPDQRKAIATSVGADNHTIWEARYVCTRRGLYRLGPTTVHTSDLFGIFKVSIHDAAEASLLITPPIMPLPNIEVASGGRSGDGRFSKGVLEQSVAVSTVRDFHPEDPLHHIHWPLTAKHNQLTTRIFENTPTGNWWIIQDMNESVQVGDPINNSLEVGVILSASLANEGLRRGKGVGFIANDQQHAWISPDHASDQSIKILRTLALSQAGNLPLDHLLQKSRPLFHQTASLVIITPDVRPDWWDSLLWFKSKGMIPTILLIDPSSFGGEGDPHTLLRRLQNAGITSYVIQAEMFADQLEVEQEPLWEWRVFGTGYAVPIKKPADLAWKSLE